MNSENVKKVTNQAVEQLVEALNAGHSETLTRYLAAMAKFRAYSFLNVLLILKQCPNAGRVAGYRTWQPFGRQVKQGANGIMILAPMFRKRTETVDESNTTDESRKVAGSRAVYVWDRLSRDLWPSLCALVGFRERPL
jgi:N-terminal domain of anti-restriction factor ArdC